MFQTEDLLLLMYVQVCSREPEVSSVFSCQWLLDVWSDTVGDVQLWRGAMVRT